MTNAAVREQEASEAGRQSNELPALLVPGGSRSHLCRSPRATPVSGMQPDDDNGDETSETARVERN